MFSGVPLLYLHAGYTVLPLRAGLPYLLGQGLGEDGHQVLQRPFGVELACVLRGAPLFRRLGGERKNG